MGWQNLLLRVLLTAVFAYAAASGAQTGPPTPTSTNRAPEAPSGVLRISGSTLMAPLMADIAKRYQDLHPGERVEVLPGSLTSRGISDVREGKVNIGMAARAPTDQEADLYSVPIARDGLSIIVHRDNPLHSLTSQQVADIFSGRITRWSMVGGQNRPITVLSPARGFASVELFSQYFNLKSGATRDARLTGDSMARVADVSADPTAITYASIGVAERRILAGAPIRMLPLDGIAPTRENVRSGNYPLSRPFTLVTKTAPRGLERAFIDFALSSQVTDLVLARDFIPYLD